MTRKIGGRPPGGSKGKGAAKSKPQGSGKPATLSDTFGLFRIEGQFFCSDIPRMLESLLKIRDDMMPSLFEDSTWGVMLTLFNMKNAGKPSSFDRVMAERQAKASELTECLDRLTEQGVVLRHGTDAKTDMIELTEKGYDQIEDWAMKSAHFILASLRSEAGHA